MRTGSVLCMMALAAALAACDREAASAAPADAAEGVEANADQVIYAFNQKVTKEGVRKADLFGDTAYTRPNDTKVQLVGVRLTFFDENTGTETGRITSKTGEFDTQGGNMVARGSVVLVVPGEQGVRTIRTEELHFDRQTDRIWSTVATTMEEGGATYRGTSFVSDAGFKNLTVQSLRTSGIRTGAGGEEITF